MPSPKAIIPKKQRLSTSGCFEPDVDRRKRAVTETPQAAPNSHATATGKPLVEPPLGNNANLTAAVATGSPAAFDSALATVTRFALQSGARELLRGERVAGCLRWRAWGRDCVEVWHLPQHQRAKYVGLQTCGSVWMCPVCATKISERRKQDLEQALRLAHEAGLFVVMVTYTARHNASQSLGQLVGHQKGKRGVNCGIMGARGLATGSRAIRKLYQEAGVVGSVRALEVTHHSTSAEVEQQNGWHPHIHELLFLTREDWYGRLWQGLRQEWGNALALVGMDANEHGVDFTPADTDIAAYVAKFGHARSWNVEHELTKQVTKKGRSASWSPSDMLAAFTFGGDLQAGDWYREYAVTMKGNAQLRWSKGLRALLGMGAELTDQEVAEEEDGSLAVVLGVLSPKVWRQVVANDMRAQLLGVAASGDWEQVCRFVMSLDVDESAPLDAVDQAEDMLEQFARMEEEAIKVPIMQRLGSLIADNDDPFADLADLDPRLLSLAELMPDRGIDWLRQFIVETDRIIERKARPPSPAGFALADCACRPS